MGTASQLPAASLAGMLRVWKMSGEELVALRREDFSESYDVADELRRLLRNRYGFPVCTQTLLLDGGKLEPTCRLSFPSDLQLILSVQGRPLLVTSWFCTLAIKGIQSMSFWQVTEVDRSFV
ncbi:ANKRD17 [Symbiodinium natans]|uniref:ANKRD17 protein n=1 Tax=Symbiodinium natans TaxID=878477 RepID=A0A812J245_9DINO|nr:ANKRD17 [Symbiodinium natans]